MTIITRARVAVLVASAAAIAATLTLHGTAAAPRFFDAQDLPPAPPAMPLARWAQSLMKAARTAEHPFNAGLMLEALVSEAQSTLNSAASRRP